MVVLLYLVGDSPSIVVDGENWQRNLGLVVVGAVSMVIVALLEEGVVSGLGTVRTRGSKCVCV